MRLPCAAHGRHASWGRLSSEGLGGTLTPAGNCHWQTRCHGVAVVASVSRDSGRAATDRLFGRAARCSHAVRWGERAALVQLTNVCSRWRLCATALNSLNAIGLASGASAGLAYNLPVHCLLGQGLVPGYPARECPTHEPHGTEVPSDSGGN